MTTRNPVRLRINGDYWRAAWRDSTGVERIKYLGNRSEVTRREALALCQSLTAEHFAAKSNETVDSWAEDFLAQNEQLAPSTEVRYRTALGWIKRFFGADALIDQITPKQCADYVAWLRRQRKGNKPDTPILAPATVWGIVTFTKMWFAEAERQNRLAKNPMARVKNDKPNVSRAKAYVPVETVEKVIAAARNDSWRAFLALARFAGLRAMEALTLEAGHVDWKARTIAVWPRGGVETTKQAARVVPMAPRLYEALRAAQKAMPEGQVRFCWDVRVDGYVRDTIRLIERAGCYWTPPLHALRSSLETDWMGEYPAPAVCKWLGHDIKVAMNHYVNHERFMVLVTAREKEPASPEDSRTISAQK